MPLVSSRIDKLLRGAALPAEDKSALLLAIGAPLAWAGKVAAAPLVKDIDTIQMLWLPPGRYEMIARAWFGGGVIDWEHGSYDSNASLKIGAHNITWEDAWPVGSGLLYNEPDGLAYTLNGGANLAFNVFHAVAVVVAGGDWVRLSGQMPHPGARMAMDFQFLPEPA